MSNHYDEITPETLEWIKQQHVFFVTTAPLSAEGHVNCSPKGLDTFRVLSPKEVAYLDITDGGAETIAHLRENGRILFTFCEFTAGTKIVRLHGQGKVILPGTENGNRRPARPSALLDGCRAGICQAVTPREIVVK